MSDQRIWYPPEHGSWLFLDCERRPETPDDIALIAQKFGCEPEEVDAIHRIVSSRDMNTHPFVVVAEDGREPPAFSVEVIALAGTLEYDVYERYNG